MMVCPLVPREADRVKRIDGQQAARRIGVTSRSHDPGASGAGILEALVNFRTTIPLKALDATRSFRRSCTQSNGSYFAGSKTTLRPCSTTFLATAAVMGLL